MARQRSNQIDEYQIIKGKVVYTNIFPLPPAIRLFSLIDRIDFSNDKRYLTIIESCKVVPIKYIVVIIYVKRMRKLVLVENQLEEQTEHLYR